MAIDWFTVGAQMINFLILIWLLKKFLYRPIINAMASREQGLVDRLQFVETQMNDAEQLKKQYESSLQQLQRDKDNILAEAKQQAETDRNRQLQSLNDELQQEKKRFEQEMYQQQQKLGAVMNKVIAEKTLQLSGKILSDLAGQSLEQQIVEHFLQNLSDLPDDEQAMLHTALSQDDAVTIISRFPLNEALRSKIRSRLDQSAPVREMVFELNEQLMAGITLEAGGRSWEWNIDRYLAELEVELLKPLE
ncbi:MAG: F0F1 ATP synthase subunit B family protein [Gammaproteobacteria bacterium]